MKLVVSARARRHLAGIARDISADNPHAARRVLARLGQSLEGLADMPYIGRAGRTADTRQWPVPGLPYVIVYTIDDATDDEATGEVIILAIYHGARGQPPLRD